MLVDEFKRQHESQAVVTPHKHTMNSLQSTALDPDSFANEKFTEWLQLLP
jgi:hypothetical protein